jgi:hypothetical protein
MKRILVAVSLVGAMTSVSGQGAVSITSIDRSMAPTFGLITLSGSGLDPGAAISIVFSARDAITVTAPAATATPTAVRVAVPPLVNRANGELFDTPVVADVQVVQVTSGSVMTSNTLGGLTIEPTPQVSGPAGTFTRAFLNTSLEVQSDLRTNRRSTPGFSDVLTASQAFTDAQAPLLDAVDQIVRNPDATVNVPTKDNMPLSISAKSLRATDRVALGFIRTMNPIYSAANPGQRQFPGPCACNVIGDLPSNLCDYRQQLCPAYDGSGRVVSEGAVAAYAGALSALASWAAGGLSSGGLAPETASGLGVLASQILAYVTAILSGADPAGAWTLLRDSGTSMLDDLNNSGLGVFSGLQSATQLTQRIEIVVVQTRGQLQTAPQGGLVLPAPQPPSPPANTRPATVYTARLPPHWFAAPVNQQVTPLSSATLATPAIARFNGAYTGTMIATGTSPNGSGGTVSTTLTLPYSATVADGRVMLTEGVTGSLSATGRFTAGAAPCTHSGRFWRDDTGAGGGSGSYLCAIGQLMFSGTWTLVRSP